MPEDERPPFEVPVKVPVWLTLMVAGFTAMAFLRTLIVLAGFGLPTGPARADPTTALIAP